jgi:hypothetical protein
MNKIMPTIKMLLNLAFIIIIISGCSDINKNTANLNVSVPAIPANHAFSMLLTGDVTAPNAPADISGFNCLLVNVVGAGIGDWEANKYKIGVNRNFSYIGTYSKLIPVVTGGSVQVRVLKGVKRYIQILGLI